MDDLRLRIRHLDGSAHFLHRFLDLSIVKFLPTFLRLVFVVVTSFVSFLLSSPASSSDSMSSSFVSSSSSSVLRVVLHHCVVVGCIVAYNPKHLERFCECAIHTENLCDVHDGKGGVPWVPPGIIHIFAVSQS